MAFPRPLVKQSAVLNLDSSDDDAEAVALPVHIAKKEPHDINKLKTATLPLVCVKDLPGAYKYN